MSVTNIIDAQRRITAALELLERLGYKDHDIASDLHNVLGFLQIPRYTQAEALSLIRQCKVVDVRQKESHQPVIWLRLPTELQATTGTGACSCGKRGCKNTWDTMAIQAVKAEHPWMIHAPEVR